MDSQLARTEQTQAHHPEKSQLWEVSSVLFVLAMGLGSVGCGYSANVMAATLGETLLPVT